MTQAFKARMPTNGLENLPSLHKAAGSFFLLPKKYDKLQGRSDSGTAVAVSVAQGIISHFVIGVLVELSADTHQLYHRDIGSQ